MSVQFTSIEQLESAIGQEFGPSPWRQVTQDDVTRFAELTDDLNWIHVDPERAANEGPFGGTIAHGYLSLSLLGGLVQDMNILPENTLAAFNYGLNRTRFISPVKSGARVRLRCRLLSMEEKAPGQYLMTVENTLEIEGEEKPALLAETLVMLYERRRKA